MNGFFVVAKNMNEPIFLLNFCLECTLELVPMLAFAWCLGWLFWWTLNKENAQKEQQKIDEQLATIKTKSTQMEEQLSNLRFEKEAANTALNSLRNNYRDLEARYKSLESLKGTSISSNYEPVPPPNSLLNDLEDKNKKQKIIYFSSDKVHPTAKKRAGNKLLKTNKPTRQKISYTSLFSPSDLKIVEGIGKKLERILKDNGISTWTRLAVTSVDQLRAILAKAGPPNLAHDPSTWPQQASLARVGQWQELIRLQKSLHPNRKSKVKKRYKRAKGINAYRIDDLQIIEGIGPKIEQQLKDGGIDNWSKLAAATLDDLKQILHAPGNPYHLADPESWPTQAAYAAKGDWEGLQHFQIKLKAGNESPDI